MKKYLFWLALIPLALFSCGSDDDVSNEPDKRSYLIIGNWKLTEEWKVWTGLGYSYESHWEKTYGDLLLSINSSGTCSVSGSCVTKNIIWDKIVQELSVWFPNINKWEWNDARPTYPLKLYYTNSSEYVEYEVIFENDNKLEITSGNIGYRFQRQK